MKQLKDFEEDVYKCSRCGLCQSVCPVYKVTLNECSVSKAKFTMLNGIIRGDLSLNKKIKSYLDLCTGCNACKNFCPSGIDAVKIFTAVKNEYYKTHKISLFEKFCNSYLLFKILLLSGKFGFSSYRFLKIDKIINKLRGLILRLGFWGKRLLLLDYLAQEKFTLNNFCSEHSVIEKTQKAVYFEGCFNQYINSETIDAVRKILEKSDIRLIEKNFECCGVSYLNDGLIDEFLKLVDLNLKECGEAFDLVLTDCASCFSVLKEYENYSQTAKKTAFSSKVVSVVSLMNSMKFSSKKTLKVAIHKPCHEENDFVEIVKNIDNVTYVDVEDYDKCCGFSGKFALKNPEISREISRKKASSYLKAAAEKGETLDIVLTTCPACILGLEQGFLETEPISSAFRPKVMNLFVFLAKYCC